MLENTHNQQGTCAFQWILCSGSQLAFEKFDTSMNIIGTDYSLGLQEF